MKPCRKQKQPTRRPAQQPDSARSVPGPPPAALHRYVHPIRTVRPAARSPLEEALSDILEMLSCQSEQLEEVLRRLERDNSDTK